MSKSELYISNESLVTQINKGSNSNLIMFGVPFDVTSTYRTGSRFGPNYIREAFTNIEIYSKRLAVDLETVNIKDLGNIMKTGKLTEMNKMVQEITNEIITNKKIPGILGGDHSLTNGSVRAYDKCNMIVFDAHLDMRNEFEGLKLSHATFLRRLIEDNKINKLIHVGTRAATKEEWDFAEENNTTIINMDEIQNIVEVIKKFKAETNREKWYVSIDLDVVDPAYAPGVGNPEANGMTSREILEFIYALKKTEIIGFDIVELIPNHDNGSTSALAARLLAELFCIIHYQHTRK